VTGQPNAMGGREIGALANTIQQWEDGVRDLSAQQEREQAIEQQAIEQREAALAANEAKSRFLAHISHEIRTPMNAIIGLTQLMKETDLDPVQTDYVQKAQSSAKTLLGIINDVLDFSKIEAGHLELERLPFSLPETMNTVAHLLDFQAREKGLELVFDQDIDIPEDLIGDPLRLSQVLINLGQNAVKFTQQGEIQVRSRLLERGMDWVRLQFSVRDTGVGMSPEQAAKLFQPFTQVDPDMARRFTGTGLGLAICRQLVQAMGGEIKVESQPNQGTTFSFDVRLTALPDHREQITQSELLGRRLLIVDDNQTALQSLMAMLMKLGFEVFACSSGRECIQALVADAENEGPGYDALILDWCMPELDGLETARLIQADSRISSKPPILMVTSFGRGKVMDADVQDNVSHILTKPLYVTELYDSLAAMLLGEQTKLPQTLADQGPAALSSPELAGRRVLLAEDNQINQEVAIAFLRQLGLEVDVAVNGRDAVDQVENGAYDLVLMDIQMPVMDGLEATRLIRSKGLTELPIVALTAHAWSDYRHESLQAGMDDHLSKPFELEHLNDLLRKWIHGADNGSQQTAETQTAGRHTPEADHAQSARPEYPGLNLDKAIKHACDSWELLEKIVAMFKQENSQTITELKDMIEGEMIEGKRLEEARQRVHTLKGQSAILGAERVSAAALQLEEALKAGDPTEPSLNLLEAAFAEVFGESASSPNQSR
ncbi:MAG: response regulator, partial [Gammaproteobacteria bacterium]